MHGAEPEVLDGTQLAADFTFSGLQKFGQGLEERLKGHKLPSKLLEKVSNSYYSTEITKGLFFNLQSLESCQLLQFLTDSN